MAISSASESSAAFPRRMCSKKSMARTARTVSSRTPTEDEKISRPAGLSSGVRWSRPNPCTRVEAKIPPANTRVPSHASLLPDCQRRTIAAVPVDRNRPACPALRTESRPEPVARTDIKIPTVAAARRSARSESQSPYGIGRWPDRPGASARGAVAIDPFPPDFVRRSREWPRSRLLSCIDMDIGDAVWPR